MAEEYFPDDTMIIFGRGKACNSHPGNVKMRLILKNYKDQYRSASKGEKAKLVRRIYDEIVGRGMKFVKQSERAHGWVEVDTQTAIEKLRHSLRNPKVGRNLKGTSSSQAQIHQVSLSGTSSNSNTTAGSSAGTSSRQVTELQQLQSTSPFSVSGLEVVGSFQRDADSLVQNSAAQSTWGPALRLNDGLHPNSGSSIQTNTTQSLGSIWPITNGLHYNAETSLEQINAVLSLGSRFPLTGAGLQPYAGTSEQTNTVSNSETSIENRLPNHLMQMEVERLRSSLAIPRVGSLVTSAGQLPSLSATQLPSADRDTLLYLASNDPRLNSVPDDPMFWIRMAVASLSGNSL